MKAPTGSVSPREDRKEKKDMCDKLIECRRTEVSRRRKRRCTTSDRLRSACVQHALALRGAVDEEAAGYDGGADGEASEDEAEQINEEEEVTGRRRRRP